MPLRGLATPRSDMAAVPLGLGGFAGVSGVGGYNATDGDAFLQGH